MKKQKKPVLIPEQENELAQGLLETLMGEISIEKVREELNRIYAVEGFESFVTIRDAFVTLVHELREAREHHRELSNHAHFDHLTQVWNRRMLERRWKEEHCGVPGQAFLLIDIDNFKLVNDTHGHDVGDAVLKEVAQRILEVLREDGSRLSSLGRYGGEEFLIILSGADEQGAMAVAERVRTAVSVWPIVVPAVIGTLAITVTLSIGVVVNQSDFEGGVKKADRGLYQAKKGGRNRVEFHSPLDELFTEQQ